MCSSVCGTDTRLHNKGFLLHFLIAKFKMEYIVRVTAQNKFTCGGSAGFSSKAAEI